MGKPKRDNTEKLERIIADIMLPGVHFLDAFEGTSNFDLVYGADFDKYLDVIEKFASARKRNYNAFRDFLDKNSELYFTRDICNLGNEEINFIFDQILEYQGDAILEKMGY